jgi:hypothetical protein
MEKKRREKRWNYHHRDLFLWLVVDLEDQLDGSKGMKILNVARGLPWNIYSDSQEFWTSN